MNIGILSHRPRLADSSPKHLYNSHQDYKTYMNAVDGGTVAKVRKVRIGASSTLARIVLASRIYEVSTVLTGEFLGAHASIVGSICRSNTFSLVHTRIEFGGAESQPLLTIVTAE